MKRPLINSLCPNPSCDKLISKVSPRFMDDTPHEVVPYHYMAKKLLVGRIYHHEDGTLCDESIYLPKKAAFWCRLGDSTIDPRT